MSPKHYAKTANPVAEEIAEFIRRSGKKTTPKIASKFTVIGRWKVKRVASIFHCSVCAMYFFFCDTSTQNAALKHATHLSVCVFVRFVHCPTLISYIRVDFYPALFHTSHALHYRNNRISFYRNNPNTLSRFGFCISHSHSLSHLMHTHSIKSGVFFHILFSTEIEINYCV